jgi:hypothetical protein
VGKSTLAAHFATAYQWPIVKLRWALQGDSKAETRTMATTTLARLHATQPSAIFDRIYFSWWAYGPVLGYDVAYMPALIAAFARIRDARLVLLTAAEAELRRRFARHPARYFSLEVILAANARFPSLLPLLPATLPWLHIDTTHTPPAGAVAQVEALING